MFKSKIKVYLVKKDRSIEILKKPFIENRVFISKDYEIIFSPEHIFLRKRKFLPPEPCLIIQDGRLEPDKLPNPNGNLMIPLTNEEIRKIIKREIAKSIVEVKPLKLNMFIILFLMLIFIIIMNIMILLRWRIMI